VHALAFVLALAALTLWWPCPASAQTPAEFYRGKTIDLDIGTSAGGGYDVHSRLLARHMSKHMPGNPTIVPKNVEGASGVRLANLLYNTAPHDGTVFGILLRNVPFEPMFGNHAAQFDASKFTWIGSASSEVSICVSWHTTGIATLDDLLTKDLIMGGIGSSSDLAVFPKIINGVLGTRMQVVNGYAGGNEVMLAMERGEVGGRCAWSGRRQRRRARIGSIKSGSTSSRKPRCASIRNCRTCRSSLITPRPTRTAASSS
jgi:tripartite-type tricarboxylate transporter receptor subunit TctC